MNGTGYAVRAQALTKRYRGGGTAALNRFDIEVRSGTVCALLGPNGAGKTTAVRILSTLLACDSGTAEVAGFDVKTQPALVRRSIGFIGQNAAVDEVLDGRQNLVLFAKLYHLRPREARKRAEELFERFGLTAMDSKPVSQYSGGYRRRLDLAASLIVTPSVLFLDEPTTGLDPRSRFEIWTEVKRLVANGTSVLLTTQYLEEADRTADMVSVLDEGRVIAEGTPDELKGRFGGDRIEIVLRPESDPEAAARILGSVTSVRFEADAESRVLRAVTERRAGMLQAIGRALEVMRIEAEDIMFRRPTLDEVFLRLTDRAGGRPADPDKSEDTGSREVRYE